MKNRKPMVAFSPHSTKLFARLFCRKFKHCCVLFPAPGGEYTLVQIGIDGIRLVPVAAREIKIMKRKGWDFVNVGAGGNAPDKRAGFHPPLQFLTCVGFAKRALNIRAPFIWTPDQLFRRLAPAKKVLSFEC